MIKRSRTSNWIYLISFSYQYRYVINMRSKILLNMDKNLFLTIASCLIFNFIFAQIQIGFRASGVYSGITIKGERRLVATSPIVLTDRLITVTKTRYKFGYYNGVIFNGKLSNELSAKLAVVYQTQGWDEDITVSHARTDWPCCASLPHVNYIETFRISYFNIPVIFNFTTPVQKKLLFFGPGLYVSFPVNGKTKSKIISIKKDSNPRPGEDFISEIVQQKQETSVTLVTFNKKDKCNCYLGSNIDLGVILNSGLLLRSGVALEVSYQLGLKDVLVNRYLIFPNRNRALSLGLTYYLRNNLNTSISHVE
jgi:hypothetical protein